MARCIIAVLVLRAVAAPVALRSTAAPTGGHLTPVLRVCAWPAHRAGVIPDHLDPRGIAGPPAIPGLLSPTAPLHPGLADAPLEAIDRPESPFARYHRRSIRSPHC